MEQVFLLAYMVPGMSGEYVERIPRRERVWHVKRLAEQKKCESEAVREQQRRRKGAAPRPRRMR